MPERIRGAIVIHGPGRSGTTLFNNILSLHPDLAWISGYVNKFPYLPQLAFLNRLQSINAFERATRGRRYFPRPAEAYDFWDFHLKRVRNYDAGFVATAEIDRLVGSLKTIMQWHGKSRLIVKLTGLARGEMLRRAFDDPVILYLDRDPRDVIVSYFKQRWLHKRTPDFEKLDRLKLIRQYADLYKSFYSTKKELSKFNLRQLKYEDLVADPGGFFSKVASYAELSDNGRFSHLVRSWNVEKGAIGKWRAFFKSNEVALLNELLAGPLRQLGYLVMGQ